MVAKKSCLSANHQVTRIVIFTVTKNKKEKSESLVRFAFLDDALKSSGYRQAKKP